MTEPIPSAGETTIIGMPAITIPVTATATSDRPLTAEDLDTIARLSDDTALLISTRGAVSGSRYLLDEEDVTRIRTFCWMTPPFPARTPYSAV